jgi:Cap4, dsDNA endonuclease domain
MSTPHGAAASAAGYQYQTWWSLLEMLRMGPDRPDATLILEMHDDVAWEANGI